MTQEEISTVRWIVAVPFVFLLALGPSASAQTSMTLANGQTLPCSLINGTPTAWLPSGQGLRCGVRWQEPRLVVQLLDPPDSTYEGTRRQDIWKLAALLWDQSTELTLSTVDVNPERPLQVWSKKSGIKALSVTVGNHDVAGLTISEWDVNTRRFLWATSFLNSAITDAGRCAINQASYPYSDAMRVAVAVHELGHALGVEHFRTSDEVMFVQACLACRNYSPACRPGKASVAAINLLY